MTQTSTPAAQPSTAHAEQAARKVVNRYVREGLITRRTANQVLAFALPFVPSQVARMRLNGWPVEEITQHFQGKLADAERDGKPIDKVGAEIYLAVWEGLQVDCAAYCNASADRAELEG
jgi:hypothetical protein